MNIYSILYALFDMRRMYLEVSKGRITVPLFYPHTSVAFQCTRINLRVLIPLTFQTQFVRNPTFMVMKGFIVINILNHNICKRCHLQFIVATQILGVSVLLALHKRQYIMKRFSSNSFWNVFICLPSTTGLNKLQKY